MQEEKGAYLFSSKDLGMVEHIPELVEAGISSLKIEGRLNPPTTLLQRLPLTAA